MYSVDLLRIRKYPRPITEFRENISLSQSKAAPTVDVLPVPSNPILSQGNRDIAQLYVECRSSRSLGDSLNLARAGRPRCVNVAVTVSFKRLDRSAPRVEGTGRARALAARPASGLPLRDQRPIRDVGLSVAPPLAPSRRHTNGLVRMYHTVHTISFQFINSLCLKQA